MHNRHAHGKAKISEQLNLKNMLKNKRAQDGRAAVENDASEMLIFTRYLGHKIEMPGSGQWRMIATQNDEQERCWVCNKEIYTLVFWSRDFGLKTQHELEMQGIDEMACENAVFELECRNQERGIKVDYHADRGNPQLHESGHKMTGYPLIYGEFNNWKPQRMYTIEELCYILDPERPDVIQSMKKGNYLRQTVNTREEMNSKERAIYEDRIKSIMTKYSRMRNWRKLLGTTLRYRKPFLANSEALLLINEHLSISKVDEELYPSDSQSDFGSGTESDEEEAEQEENDGDDTSKLCSSVDSEGMASSERARKHANHNLKARARPILSSMQSPS